MLSLNELCRELTISQATGKNWIRTGRLKPAKLVDGIPYFSKKYAAQTLEMVKNTDNSLLKSRRNKRHISGNGIYKSYIDVASCNADSAEQVIALLGERGSDRSILLSIVAECALQMINQVFELNYEQCGSFLARFLDGSLKLGIYEILIRDLLEGVDIFQWQEEKVWAALQIPYVYEPGEDTLGLLYLSLKNMGERKAAGAYYTPTRIVKKLIGSLMEKGAVQGKILDPCCGTGNFCLQLPDDVEICNIYAKDIDRISVQIARINLVLRYKTRRIQQVYENIRVENYLLEEDGQVYDCILGNPPWGFEFSQKETEQLKSRYQSTVGKNVESYDVFLEQSIEKISKNGTIAFVLPEAVLHVKSHQSIRKVILKETRIEAVSYLGNTFPQVQCPSIILMLTKRRFSTIGMRIAIDNQEFTIETERNAEISVFNFQMEDREYLIFEKICKTYNADYLKRNADFALGIVTGDNHKYVTSVPETDKERVLKGANLYKYSIEEPDCYIRFIPEQFQQVAPEAYYRAPEKLLYRFVSSQLVFAYDDRQLLSLNSCNIMIPRIPRTSMKYILAVLNSRIAQFWFQRKFRSTKVLRSHLEQLPIPKASEMIQKEIEEYVKLLINGESHGEKIKLYNELDEIISRLYHLSDTEYKFIYDKLNQQNLFIV